MWPRMCGSSRHDLMERHSAPTVASAETRSKERDVDAGDHARKPAASLTFFAAPTPLISEGTASALKGCASILARANIQS